MRYVVKINLMHQYLHFAPSQREKKKNLLNSNFSSQILATSLAMWFAEQLGQRLETESGGIHKQKAQLCYAIAGDLHKLVDNWMSAIQPTTPEQMQVLPQLTCISHTVHFFIAFCLLTT